MNRSANFLCLIFFFLIGTSMHQLHAQLINPDTLVYPITTTGQSFENYLVSLAWENNPEYKIHASNINIAQKEIKLAKRAWADDWNITLNLNENNIQIGDDTVPGITLDSTTNQNLLDLNVGNIIPILETPEQAVNINTFPRFNFGLTLNLGSLITRGLEVEIAEEKLIIEQYTGDQDKKKIRAEVYKAYTEYKQAIRVLKTVTKQEQNAADIFDLMKTRFKNGQIDFDTYNQSSSEYNRALQSLITAEEKVTLTRMKIEELTGVTLTLAKFYYDQNNGQ